MPGNHTCNAVRPIVEKDNSEVALTAQQKYDDLLDAEDVIGKRFILTRLSSNVTIREENAPRR